MSRTKPIEELPDGSEGMTIGEASANKLERQFFSSALDKKGAKVWRSGWPDFLVYLPELGHIGVEVKSATDHVRPNQAKMFAALEAAGLRVFVWEPAHAKRLIPWRKHIDMRAMGVKRPAREIEEHRLGLLRELDEARSLKDKQRIANRLAWAAGTYQPPPKRRRN